MYASRRDAYLIGRSFGFGRGLLPVLSGRKGCHFFVYSSSGKNVFCATRTGSVTSAFISSGFNT